jgi:hypothetical protein
MPPQRKLNPDQVREIRRLAELYSYRYLSNVYGVSVNTLMAVKNRKTYKDVKDKDDETNRTTTQDRD